MMNAGPCYPKYTILEFKGLTILNGEWKPPSTPISDDPSSKRGHPKLFREKDLFYRIRQNSEK
jgi:hypothetical protein